MSAAALPLAAAAENASRVSSGTQGMVVSVSRPASEAGLSVLQNGGNAVDAAVATAFALCVTYPEAGNIGGGGFMLVLPSAGEPPECIDYRETAPAAAHAHMFTPESSYLGPRTVGVPGTVRGMALAHRRHGRMEWKKLLEPAVRLAAEGFELDSAIARSLNLVLAESPDNPALLRLYTNPKGAAWQAGDRLVQPQLAATLRTLADDGPDAFYRGPIAGQIVAAMQPGDGLITAEDLAHYEARVRAAIHGTFRGFDIYAPPPPSSGGIVLVEMLNILERFDLAGTGRWQPQTNHWIIEAMRRAYRDRAAYLGDPDFTPLPQHLTSKAYAAELAKQIDPQRATPSEDLAGDIPLADAPHTTHFSVIDAAGMAVANTYTLEQEYGSRVVVPGCGFVLNNEMGDFSWAPGVTDRLGKIGTPPNQIAPGKRMLSAQMPTIVLRDGRPVLVTGSPGGRTIINTVLCVLLNTLEFQLDMTEVIDAPRLNQTWLPDRVQFEAADDPHYAQLVAGLRAMGHNVVRRLSPQGEPESQGDAHSIFIRDGRYWGVPDRRISGWAAGY